MKKTFGLLALGLTGIAALASCGSKEEEVTTTVTDPNITTVMEGFVQVDEISAYREIVYYSNSVNSSVIEAQVKDKNATFTYHYESSLEGKTVTDDSKRIINCVTSDFYYEETYTESHDSKPDTPYSYSYKITGSYDENTSTWDCYIDYDIKNYEVEGEPESVYSPILDDYVESTTYEYLSESGHLKALKQTNVMSSSYGQFLGSYFLYYSYPVLEYYMNDGGDLQFIARDEDGGKSFYQYCSKGIFVKAISKNSDYTVENSLVLSDAEEIKMPDATLYEKSISASGLGDIYSFNPQYKIQGLAELILGKN